MKNHYSIMVEQCKQKTTSFIICSILKSTHKSASKASFRKVFCLQKGPSFGKSQLLNAPTLANQNKNKKWR